jgi:hypothetical protein
MASLIPNPRLKNRGSMVIASKKGEDLCEITLYWHEYGGYTRATMAKRTDRE